MGMDSLNLAPSSGYTCHICGTPGIVIDPSFPSLPRLTSDIKPWPPGGQVGICTDCGSVVKPITSTWQDEIKRIYQQYTIYHQGAGAEQKVFDASGRSTTRSEHIIRWILGSLPIAHEGRLLDVGCGNGSFLSTFMSQAPSWRVDGADLSNQLRPEVTSTPAFGELFTCPISQISRSYELVTLIHVLEHVVDPVHFLRFARKLLATRGHLLIAVPNLERNPFDLTVADHCTHFTMVTLRRVIARAGLSVVSVESGGAAKELVVLCSLEPTEGGVRSVDPVRATSPSGLTTFVSWLQDVRAQASHAASSRPFGVIGTSTAATWLSGALPDLIDFYLDEDPSRTGSLYLRKPVYAPADGPARSTVYVPLAPEQAPELANRLRALGRFHLHFAPSAPSSLETDGVS